VSATAIKPAALPSGETLGVRIELIDGDSTVGHQLGVTQKHRAAGDLCLYAMTGKRTKLAWVGRCEPAVGGAGDDRLRQRVLGIALDRRRLREHLILTRAG